MASYFLIYSWKHIRKLVFLFLSLCLLSWLRLILSGMLMFKFYSIIGISIEDLTFIFFNMISSMFTGLGKEWSIIPSTSIDNFQIFINFFKECIPKWATFKYLPMVLLIKPHLIKHNKLLNSITKMERLPLSLGPFSKDCNLINLFLLMILRKLKVF